MRTPVPDEYARIWRTVYIPGLEKLDGFLQGQLLRIHELRMNIREIPEHGSADFTHLVE